MRCDPPALSDRPPASLSVVLRSVRDDFQAGTSPKSRPVTIERPRVNASTGRSTLMCCSRGNISGTTPRRARTLQTASSRPSEPPAMASTRLSVSNWRTMRLRPAPSATRTAISFSRVAARASSRLARLAQAINSSRPTAPSRIIRTGRMRPVNISAMGNRVMPQPVLRGRDRLAPGAARSRSSRRAPGPR